MLKKLLVIVCIISILASFSINTNATENEHPVGLVWNTTEEIAPYLESEGFLDELLLPSSVDNTSSFPPPGNQLSQKSCVAWAVGYALKSSQEYTKRNWSISTTNHHFSPSYIFNELNGGINSGISILEAMKFAKENGVCPMTYFPYDANNFGSAATSLQHEAAKLYQVASFGTTRSIGGIKYRISQGTGVVIAIEVYPDFDNISSSNDTYDTVKTNETSRGGHAICLIGYDNSKNAFKFINSWGSNWGLNGYGWISYDLVKDSNVNRHGNSHGFFMTTKKTDNYIMGDIDEDGSVTAADSRLALRYTSDLETFTDRQKVLADVDGDASVTAADARYIARYESGLITQMPLYD